VAADGERGFLDYGDKSLHSKIALKSGLFPVNMRVRLES